MDEMRHSRRQRRHCKISQWNHLSLSFILSDRYLPGNCTPRESTTPFATIYSSSTRSILNLPGSVINCLNTTKSLRRGESMSTREDEVSLTSVRSQSSYPYSEQHDQARLYLRARCPAWCDRILLNHSFKTHVNVEVRFLHVSSRQRSTYFQAKSPVYNILGEDVCMGDHKVRSIALPTL